MTRKGMKCRERVEGDWTQIGFPGEGEETH